MNLLLPYPDSLNRHWRYDRGIVHISRTGQEYRDKVITLCRTERVPKIGTSVSVELWIAPPDKKKRDIDNLTKAVLDALTHAGVWKDDSIVKRLHLEWCHPEPKRPCVLVTITPHNELARHPIPVLLLTLKQMNQHIFGR